MKSCNAKEGVRGCFNLFAAKKLELPRYEYIVKWQSSFLDSSSVLRVPASHADGSADVQPCNPPPVTCELVSVS